MEPALTTYQTKQRGSAVLIIIVVVIVVGLLGALGYVGYKMLSESSAKQSAASQNSSASKDDAEKSTSTPKADDTDKSAATDSETLGGIRIGMTKAEAEQASGLTGLTCDTATDGSDVCHNADYTKMITYTNGKVSGVIMDDKVLSADGKVRPIPR